MMCTCISMEKVMICMCISLEVMRKITMQGMMKMKMQVIRMGLLNMKMMEN